MQMILGGKGMNREIKFRSWDKISKVMCQVAELSFWDPDLDNDTIIYDLSSGFNHRYISKEDIELLQYTGLKDCNNKEIYEGDIVKCEDGIGTIYFHQKGYWFVYQPNALLAKFGICKMVKDYDCIEVIGNIYENPELLEGI